jgi:LmbE family N-acetylglucosaminyl deacetylase
MLSRKKILILSPHTDDGELGCGGTISKINNINDIYYVAFSSCQISIPENYSKDSLKKECKKATEILGIKPENVIFFDYQVRSFPLHRQEILEDMIDLNKRIKPDLVLVPSSNDTHQDHQSIYAEALRAFKKTSSIWGYEHPWNNLTFTTDIFVKLTEKNIQIKIEALKQYHSQDSRPYFKKDYIRSLAYTRGTQIDCLYAETFECIRIMVV